MSGGGIRVRALTDAGRRAMLRTINEAGEQHEARYRKFIDENIESMEPLIITVRKRDDKLLLRTIGAAYRPEHMAAQVATVLGALGAIKHVDYEVEII